MTYEINENGYQVMKVKEVVTTKQTAIVKTHHDMVYVTDLSYDGVNKKVSASVFKWDESTSQHTLDAAHATPIIFEYEGTQVESTPVDGVAIIDFVTDVAGEHIVKTVNEKMRNGEVIINV
jgi:hypothetical protein